jgi:hypothetical protein
MISEITEVESKTIGKYRVNEALITDLHERIYGPGLSTLAPGHVSDHTAPRSFVVDDRCCCSHHIVLTVDTTPSSI